MLRNDPMFLMAAAACLVVVVVLVLGIGSFARGGEFGRKNSNRLMRYRIVAQGVAVILIMGFAWLNSGGGN